MSIRHPALIAVLAILIADLALTLNDALIKQAQGGVGLWAVFWLRSLTALPLMTLVTLAFKAPLIPRQLWLVSVRTGLLLIGWVCLYRALPVLPIANATAALYTIPIMIVVMTTVMDRKRPSTMACLAVLIGFTGVLLIVQPQGGRVSAVYILPLISAFTYACAMILTNKKLTGEHPLTVALNLNIGFLMLGLVGLLITQGDPTQVIQSAVQNQQFTFAYMGVCLVVGTIGVAVAYQNAMPTLVSTFDYSYLIFAIFWGVVFFNEIPTLTAMAGMALIAIAGILALRRT